MCAANRGVMWRSCARPKRRPFALAARGRRECHQDHIVYAVRAGADFEVLPGALTRLHSAREAGRNQRVEQQRYLGAERFRLTLPPAARPSPHERFALASPTGDEPHGGFFLLDGPLPGARLPSGLPHLGHRHAGDRGAEFRRAETLPAHLESPAAHRWRRARAPAGGPSPTGSIVTGSCVLPQPGSIFRTLQRALANAETMRDSISPEAWSTLNDLQTVFRKAPYQAKIAERHGGAHHPPHRRSGHTTHPAVLRHRLEYHAGGRWLALLPNRS